MFAITLPVAGISEIWVDEFDNASLISYSAGVSVAEGKALLSPAEPLRQGEQIGGGVISPSLLRVGSSYSMYYATCCPGNAIMLATSSDANNWTNQGVAISPGLSGSTDSGSVAYEDVLFVGSTFHMWYSGSDSSGTYAIHHAKSSDGKAWTPDGVVISAVSEGVSGSVYDPSVIWDGRQYSMWFSHYDGAHTWIRMATSSDGLSWISHGIVLSPVSNGLEEGGPRMPSVLRAGSELLMWYTCVGISPAHICKAHSFNGLNWTRDGAVLGPDPRVPGEDAVVSEPDVLALSPNTYRIWYVARGSIYGIFSAILTTGYGLSGTILSVPITIPANFTWLWARVTKTVPVGTSLTLTVNDASTGLRIQPYGNLMEDSVDLGAINAHTVPRIALQAWFQSNGNDTPVLGNWSVAYGTPPIRAPSVWDQYLPLILVGGVGGGGVAVLLALMAVVRRRGRRPPFR